MKPNAHSITCFAIAILFCFAGNAGAQHLHIVPHTTTHIDHIRHGNHYHNVPHTTTHYHSFWHNGPDYVYPNSYQSGYSGIVQSSPVYFNSPNIVSAPSVAPYVINSISPQPTVALASATIPTAGGTTVNKIPVSNTTPSAPTRVFKLTNPSGTEGSVAYMLNSYPYTIQPGQSQTVPLDRDWVVKFSNGLGKEVSYKLAEGKYEFTVSAQHGWDLEVRKDTIDAPPAPQDIVPTLPQNAIPTTAK